LVIKLLMVNTEIEPCRTNRFTVRFQVLTAASMVRCVVSLKLTDVSEVIHASIIMAINKPQEFKYRICTVYSLS
jgi:hypothetical protein